MARDEHRREQGSIYTVPEDAVGEARIYGLFKSQRILGYPCDIECIRVDDCDPSVQDIFGFDMVTRGDSAIHVSGLDPFGRKTGPGFIRALGRQQIHWQLPSHIESPPSGLGSRGPEVGMIVSWDADAAGSGHRSDVWQHHVFWSAPKSFLTLRGVHRWWRNQGMGDFSVGDLAARLDAGRKSYLRVSGDVQHEGAFRRLLEGHVGVSNNRLPGDHGPAVLRRVGRWRYTFTDGDTV